MDHVERRSRLTTFFRCYALGIVLSFVAFLSWFAIVVLGRQPESLQQALSFCLAYTTRADALMFLITETYPPFGDDV
jgi:hypothetical protein